MVQLLFLFIAPKYRLSLITAYTAVTSNISSRSNQEYSNSSGCYWWFKIFSDANIEIAL